ncbi:MAG: hypothetical protein FJX76_29110 [Armatimonadetes bacterium]|nr:hypothetical protein [Armatimonadota bacterium]
MEDVLTPPLEPVPRHPSDLDVFRARLAETVSWCADRVSVRDARSCLRSSDLRPTCVPWIGCGGDLKAASPTQRAEIVDWVARRRAELLASAGVMPRMERLEPVQRKGRLLAYLPAGTGWDAAAEYTTNGLFDENDTPPWDCWVTWVEEAETGDSYLLCWIPEGLMGLADSGAAVTPMESLVWVRALDAPFVRRLQQAGFR